MLLTAPENDSEVVSPLFDLKGGPPALVRESGDGRAPKDWPIEVVRYGSVEKGWFLSE